ncbi:efflux RND transporter periplasmic adaptor subunit [Sphingomonas glacialis]|nr:efflux RND transporter periplasmic adaptor subunit [Sphingomonas glacialis]
MIDHPELLVEMSGKDTTCTKPPASTAPAPPDPANGTSVSPDELHTPAFVKSHKWTLLMAFALVAAVVFASVTWLRGISVPVAIARRANLVETVVASGHVESRFRVDIGSQMTGTVEQVSVQEGETVRKGQPLIVLASDELTNTQTQARDVMVQAQAHIRQLRELSLPTAREARRSAAASLLATQQIYDRATILMRKGFMTRAALDDAQKNLDMARATVRTANAQIESAQVGGSDYATAQSQLDQARAALAAASSRLAYTTILAPRDGVLIARSVERGAVVTPGQTLMVLAPAGSVQLVVQIDERNLGKVALGQPALASADAYPNKQFPATIVFINPGVDITRASATVKLAVATPPAYLRQDMTVSVDIETARRQAAIVLPGTAVHDALSTKPWVLLVRNGRAVRQNVTLGLQGNLQVQILRGVAVGNAAVPTTASITAGRRVRAQAP